MDAPIHGFLPDDKEESDAVRLVLDRLEMVRRNGDGWMALCPAHEDKNPSLSIHEGDGRVLLKCFAGCTTQSICASLGIQLRELFDNNGTVVSTYDYQDESGKLLFQVIRYHKKNFRQRRPDGRGGWIWNLNGTRRVLYGLPELLAAKDVLVVEGEKDVQTARALGLVATCNPGGAGKWRPEYSESLRGKRVAIIADADEPGRKHAQQVAASLFGKVESLRVLEFSNAKDLSDWCAMGGKRDALLGLIQSAAAWTPQAIEGNGLLGQVFAFIRRFVSLSESQARVVAIWVVHTHVIQAADATPYLAITSAEKQSGKTRLLEVLEIFVANQWLTGSVTAAVLTRKIDAECPTLLLDESDAAFGGEPEYAEALRGVLNTGHRRGGKRSCCVGQGTNITFRDFSTYCPKAIAGIGKLPDTVADRAIPIRLKRAAPGEGVERFRLRDIQAEAANLREQIESWSALIVEKLPDLRPELPDALTDRQQDGAEPLLAIADLAGGDWPEALRRALVELCAQAQAADDSIGVRLLGDIRKVFSDRGVDRISSTDLVAALCEIETSPWAEWSHGKPLTTGKLARQLARYEISPHNIRIAEEIPKGYLIGDLADAWARYIPTTRYVPAPVPAPLPGFQNATAATSFVCNYLEAKNGATENGPVAPQNVRKPASNGPCSGVALSNPGTGEEDTPPAKPKPVEKPTPKTTPGPSEPAPKPTVEVLL